MAVVIIGVAAPPMLLAIRDASVRRAAPIRTAQARWLAGELLEDIIADRSSSTRGYPYLVNANYPAESPVSGFPGFSRSVTIAETAANLVSAGTGYKKVTVTVSWTDERGAARALELATVVTDY